MLSNLQVLNIGNNSFEGTIPSFMGSMNSLSVLSLRANKFTGSIPKEITKLDHLQILDLSINNLSGPIPSKIGSLKMLTIRPIDVGQPSDPLSMLGYKAADIQLLMVIKGIVTKLEHLYTYSSGIDLSCNILDGNIPEEISQLKGLAMLNLSHNRLTDVIPRSLGNMHGLDSLELSFNKLSGNIPPSILSLDSLGYMNLSYNNLSGEIPRGPHFDTLSGDGSAYVQNSLLCGFIIQNTCEGDRRNNTTGVDSPNEVDEDYKEKLLLYAIVALGFVVGFRGLFFVLLLKKEQWWFPYWRFVNSVALIIASCILNS